MNGLFSLTESEDGSIRISYEDYKVDAFGGSSYEAIYDIDSENKAKLFKYLVDAGNTGTLNEMLVSEFGERLDKKSFASTCDENEIKYKLFTWIDD